jgi:hypothetical protein
MSVPNWTSLRNEHQLGDISATAIADTARYTPVVLPSLSLSVSRSSVGVSDSRQRRMKIHTATVLAGRLKRIQFISHLVEDSHGNEWRSEAWNS